MKKFSSFLLINMLIFSVYADKAERISCKDALFTRPQHMEICLDMQAFAQSARQAFSTNPERAHDISNQTFIEWNKILRDPKIRLSPNAIQHIEAVIWDSGLNVGWVPLYSSKQALKDFCMEDLGPQIINLGQTSFTTFQMAKKATLRLNLENENIQNISWLEIIPCKIENITTGNVIFALLLVVPIIIKGRKKYLAVSNKLPFIYFDSETEVDAYIESLQKND